MCQKSRNLTFIFEHFISWASKYNELTHLHRRVNHVDGATPFCIQISKQFLQRCHDFQEAFQIDHIKMTEGDVPLSTHMLIQDMDGITFMFQGLNKNSNHSNITPPTNYIINFNIAELIIFTSVHFDKINFYQLNYRVTTEPGIIFGNISFSFAFAVPDILRRDLKKWIWVSYCWITTLAMIQRTTRNGLF